MAVTNYQLPFEVERNFNVLQTEAPSGVVIRGLLFPRLPERRFKLTYKTLHQVDLDVLQALVDAAKGSAVPFFITLPKVGSVEVRIDDDGYEFACIGGKLRTIGVTLIEEPRYV